MRQARAMEMPEVREACLHQLRVSYQWQFAAEIPREREACLFRFRLNRQQQLAADGSPFQMFAISSKIQIAVTLSHYNMYIHTIPLSSPTSPFPSVCSLLDLYFLHTPPPHSPCQWIWSCLPSGISHRQDDS